MDLEHFTKSMSKLVYNLFIMVRFKKIPIVILNRNYLYLSMNNEYV